MNLSDSEKLEIKNLVKKVTRSYMRDLQYIIDSIDRTEYIDDLLANREMTENYNNFSNFASYLMGTDMSVTPRQLFWDLDTGQRDYLFHWLQELPKKLFEKIDKHIDSFNTCLIINN